MIKRPPVIMKKAIAGLSTSHKSQNDLCLEMLRSSIGVGDSHDTLVATESIWHMNISWTEVCGWCWWGSNLSQRHCCLTDVKVLELQDIGKYLASQKMIFTSHLPTFVDPRLFIGYLDTRCMIRGESWHLYLRSTRWSTPSDMSTLRSGMLRPKKACWVRGCW